MRDIGKLRTMMLSTAFFGLLGDPATADYILTPLSGGADEIWIDVNGTETERTFTVDLILTTNAGDAHLSSEFRLLFSQPGLTYFDYNWGTGYTTGGIDDVSVPFIDDIPTIIDENSFGSPADIDLYFSNLTNDGEVFGEGILTRLTLMVPAAWEPVPDSINIWVVPELFFDGFNAIPTAAGPTFTLNIVPAPGTLCLFSGVLLFGRRRRRMQ
jgi:hypothetical protein